MIIDFILNGEDVSARADPLEPLSSILGVTFGLSSVPRDCGSGVCGKCSAFLDGRLVNTCLVPAFKARGSEVVTFEGFRSTPAYALVKAAFEEAGSETCPSCEAAKHLAIGSLIDQPSRPDDRSVAEATSSVYCRCQAPSSTLAAARRAVDKGFGSGYGRSR